MEWRRLWPRLIASAMSLCVLGFVAFKVPSVRHYVALTFNEPSEAKSLALTDTTLGSRTIMWSDTAQMISDYPVFGTGPGTWQWFHPQYQPKEMQVYAELAHNDILNLTSDYGIVGALLLLWAIVAFFRHAAAFVGSKNSSDHRSFAIGSAIALTVILVHSWFDFNLHIPANALLLTTLIGFTVAMEDGANSYPRVDLNRKGRLALGILLLTLLGVGGWCAGRTAVAYYHQVQAKRNKSNLYWKTALNLYHRAISCDPKAPTPYARIGDIHRLQSFWRVGPTRKAEREQLAREAIEAYHKSLQLNPRQVEVWLGLAKSYDLAGEPERAEDSRSRCAR